MNSKSVSILLAVVVLAAIGWHIASDDSSKKAAIEDRLKVGFIYVGPTGDHGWTYAHEVARQDVMTHFGDKVETSYVENVPEGPDAARVIRELARQGNKIIFTTSFGYMDPTLKVSKEFPDVRFEHITGYKRSGNMATGNIRFYEGRYVQGVVAGMMTGSDAVPEKDAKCMAKNIKKMASDDQWNLLVKINKDEMSEQDMSMDEAMGLMVPTMAAAAKCGVKLF